MYKTNYKSLHSLSCPSSSSCLYRFDLFLFPLSSFIFWIHTHTHTHEKVCTPSILFATDCALSRDQTNRAETRTIDTFVSRSRKCAWFIGAELWMKNCSDELLRDSRAIGDTWRWYDDACNVALYETRWRHACSFLSVPCSRARENPWHGENKSTNCRLDRQQTDEGPTRSSALGHISHHSAESVQQFRLHTSLQDHQTHVHLKSKTTKFNNERFSFLLPT